MTFIDWLVLLIPIVAVLVMASMVQKYCRGVAGFLAGGRVAGRYVLSVAAGEAAVGLISLVAIFEMYYKGGFAISFWQGLASPVYLIMTLTGFCIYRYRETRAMTLAQFLELRYSRSFRVFAGLLAFTSGLLNFAIFPAVAARFFLYYCELPDAVNVLGLSIPTYGLLLVIVLGFSAFIACWGGQLTIMTSDCLQGIFSYTAYAIIVIVILNTFSFRQFEEAMLHRGEGRSFVDPFDTGELTDFNILFVFIGIISAIYSRLAWQGSQGYNCSAESPHEQKMAGVLGGWRGGVSGLMILLLAAAGYTYLNHPDFAPQAAEVRAELVERIDEGSETTQATLQNQLLIPIAIREFLPVGIVGLFCAVMFFLMVSTDTTYMHSWASILVQDVILPFRKRPFSSDAHIALLRAGIIGVALFAFAFSLLYSQSTYIIMFMALTGSIFLGGAGSVIIGGLYWRKGTAAGAWAAMIAGLIGATVGFVCTQYWASHLYPTLSQNHAWVLASLAYGLDWLGTALPIANWEVGPEKCPISGQEFLLLTMFLAAGSYVLVSLVTCREDFDLDAMLHRKGRPKPAVARKYSFGQIVRSMTGIDSEYTRGDRILAWSVVVATAISMVIFFIIAITNLFFVRWSEEVFFGIWKYYHVTWSLGVGLITTVWFTIGSVLGLRSLFRKLADLEENPVDDGRVIGHTNAADLIPNDDETLN